MIDCVWKANGLVLSVSVGYIFVTRDTIGDLIQKRTPPQIKPMCHTLIGYRTIVDDYFKVVEIVEWLKVC